jgi:general secretion pathway protein D
MATMKIVDEWIYPTRYEFQIVQFDLNGDGDFNDANETLYKNVPTDFVKRDVGILLRVTPSVGLNDDTITLTLIPEVSDGTAGYFSYTGDVSLPLFTSRNLSTSVVVDNGDTVVLGGLIKESQTKVTTKIPLLGDLPWVGKLFRKDTDSITRKNLLIFVTATIISPRSEQVVFKRS